MRIQATLPLVLAAACLAAGCIIVPPQNACVFPTPSPGSGTGTNAAGSPAAGTASASASPGAGSGSASSPSPATAGSTPPGSNTLLVSPATVNLSSLGAAPIPLTASNANTNLTFQSDNPAIATVDSQGRVTGVAPGTANITVTAGPQSAKVPVTVKQVPATLSVSATLPGNPRTISLTAGVPVPLTLAAKDANGNPIAGATFRFDPDPGTSPTAITIDAGTGLVSLDVTGFNGRAVSGTIRAVTPAGEVSADANSLRVTAGTPSAAPSAGTATAQI